MKTTCIKALISSCFSWLFPAINQACDSIACPPHVEQLSTWLRHPSLSGLVLSPRFIHTYLDRSYHLLEILSHCRFLNHYWVWDVPLRYCQAWGAGPCFLPLGPSKTLTGQPISGCLPLSTWRSLMATSRYAAGASFGFPCPKSSVVLVTYW